MSSSGPLESRVFRHQFLRPDRGKSNRHLEIVALVFDGDDGSDTELAMPDLHAGADRPGMRLVFLFVRKRPRVAVSDTRGIARLPAVRIAQLVGRCMPARLLGDRFDALDELVRNLAQKAGGLRLLV